MKKDYVSLKMQVVDVQLSDCIAGSIGPNSDFSVTEGSTDITEINNTGGSINFGTW